MDMTDEEREERLERQKKELELRAKKRNSRIFLLLGSIFEIAETLAVILLLFIFFSFLIFRVFQFCTIVSFLGGLFLGFMIYKTAANFIIEKFNLTDKLTTEILGHYSKRFKNAEKEAKKR